MFGRSPRWIATLLAARGRLVAPFGLTHPVAAGRRNQIGIFPILTEAPERVVLGLDDKHLDFRLVVDVALVDGRQRVTATTIVKTHNLFGRSYLAIILPFHRIIARAQVRQAAMP